MKAIFEVFATLDYPTKWRQKSRLQQKKFMFSLMQIDAGQKACKIQGWFRLGLKLTYNCWFQVNENGSGNVLSCSSFAEKGVEGIIPASNGLVARHLAVRLNSMLQAVQFPTGITNLNSGLADVN